MTPATQLPLRLGSVTAPDWSADPAGWCAWLLTTNGHLFVEFRRLVDDMLSRQPTARLSADQVCHVMRWNAQLRSEGDLFKVNNNAAALFARLYVVERPWAAGVFETRRSKLDELTQGEWDRILLAFEPLRSDRPRRRP